MATRKSNTKRTIAAAAYVRMSSSKQERSPAQQTAEINKLAKREGCQIAPHHRFADEGIYGDSGPDKRPGFRAMLDAAERGEFSVLLLWDGDRLGRFDSIDGNEYYSQLRRSNVQIITCTDGPIDLDSFEGRVVHTFKQEGRHQYVVKLAEGVVRGKIDNAKAGNWNGGPAYFGMSRALVGPNGEVAQRLAPGEYASKPGHHVRLVPGDPEAIEAVRYAFKRFAEADLSLRALACELQSKGFPSPRGNGWTHGNVRRMLTCSAYIGSTRWGQTSVAKYFYASGEKIAKVGNGHKGRFESKQPEDMIEVEETHRGIIDPKLFQGVQRKIDRRTQKRGKGRPCPKGQFPLSGLIVCEHCGRPMRHETRYAKSRQGEARAYHYKQFVCATYAEYGTRSELNPSCLRHTVEADNVTRWLTKALREVILGQKRDDLVAEVKRQLAEDSGSNDGEAKRLETRLRKLDQEIARLVKAVRTVDMPELLAELQAARADRDQVSIELDRLGRLATVDDLDAEAERVAAEAWHLGEALDDADPPTVRELVRQVVSKVVCRWERYTTSSGKTRARLVGGDVILRDCDLFAVFHSVGCPS